MKSVFWFIVRFLTIFVFLTFLWWGYNLYTMDRDDTVMYMDPGVVVESKAVVIDEVQPKTEEFVKKAVPTRVLATMTPPEMMEVSDEVAHLDLVSGYGLWTNTGTMYLGHIPDGYCLAYFIGTPEGVIVASDCASSLVYDHTHDIERVFAPSAGNIYSYQDETGALNIWCHSGYWVNDPLTCQSLVSYVRWTGGVVNTLEQTMDKVNTNLLNSDFVWCVLRKTDEVSLSNCQMIALGKITGVAIVPHEDLPEYEARVNSGQVEWMASLPTTVGFAETEDVFYVKTCLSGLADQPESRLNGFGTQFASWNRLVLQIQIKAP
jgi:hypothetical protein